MNLLYQQLRDEIEQVAENTGFYQSNSIEKRLWEKSFPLASLPKPLRTFAQQVAESKQCPIEFVILPMLSVVASAIGNSRLIKIKEDWIEIPAIWTAVIGESGSGKTPALSALLEPIEEIEKRFAIEDRDVVEQYERDKLLYDKDVKQWLKDTSKPPPTKPEPVAIRRCRVSDVTIEALAPLLRDNQRGLLVERDEIAGWIASFDQYKGKKGGSDSANWLSIFSGKSITIDRKTGDISERNIRIPEPIVSITGGTQPAILTRFLTCEHRESGLAARFLFVYRIPNARKWDKRSLTPETKNQYENLINKLFCLKPEELENGEKKPVLVTMSAEAEQIWESFFNTHSEELSEFIGDLSAAWAKLLSYAGRIALVIHCVKEATGKSTSKVIDEETMRSAIQIIKWVKHETIRVYSFFTKSDKELEFQRAADRIQKDGGSMSVREACRRFKRNTEDAERLLRQLIEAGYGAWQDDDEQSTKVGRPKSRIFELFQEDDEPNEFQDEKTDFEAEGISFNPNDKQWIDEW